MANNNIIYVLMEEVNTLTGYIVTREEFTTWKKENPENIADIVQVYELKAKGDTYKDKKAYIEAVAIDYSHADNGNNNLDDLCYIYNFFEVNGRRFGLLTDFRENAII